MYYESRVMATRLDEKWYYTSHTTVANIHLPIAIIKKQFYSEVPVDI